LALLLHQISTNSNQFSRLFLSEFFPGSFDLFMDAFNRFAVLDRLNAQPWNWNYCFQTSLAPKNKSPYRPSRSHTRQSVPRDTRPQVIHPMFDNRKRRSSQVGRMHTGTNERREWEWDIFPSCGLARREGGPREKIVAIDGHGWGRGGNRRLERASSLQKCFSCPVSQLCVLWLDNDPQSLRGCVP
jgi:hypothetical protein